MGTPILEVRGISKKYGSNIALNDVSMSVDPQSVHAVIGPNGAGKSTLFGVIAGEYRCDTGEIRLNGKQLPKRTHECVRAGVVKAFQVARIFSSMSVAENMELAVICAKGRERRFWYGARRAAARAEVLEQVERVGLGDQSRRLAATLAQGDRKRLEIGLALAAGASVVLLDEPTAGMSPEETNHTVELVRRLQAEQGVTVLITEHDMDVVYGLADRITVLHRGAVLMTGEPEAVRADKRVLEVYMGREA
ncbi:MAG: ABC transporter ATP-binding protein [Streptosporangiaceae bacterium]